MEFTVRIFTIRLPVTILLFIFLLWNGGEVFAQEFIVVSENFENAPLSKVLKKLRNQYKIKIAYDNQLVQGIEINQRLENVPLKEAFAAILSSTKLTYQFINGKVIIIPKQEQEVVIDPPVAGSAINVSGIIKDKDSGETLPNASIRIAGTNKGVITNTDGFFTLIQVPDTSTLIINYLGYGVKKIKLAEIGDLSNLRIDLESELKILEEVTITDQFESPLEVKEKVSKAAFNPKALASLPSLGGQDLFRTLQLMPGVSGTNESSSGLVIRGAIPSQNLVLLDGFTIYHLDHFFGVFSGINADIIKDVQIYKGGFDAKYGGRVSGVVDITGRTGNTNKAKFNFGANLMSLNATADVPISKKISFLFSTRRAYTDVIQSNFYKKLFAIARDTDEQLKRPVSDPKFDGIDPSFFFYDINTKLSYRPSSKDIISLSIYGGKDDLWGKNSNSQKDPQNQIFYQEDIKESTVWGNNGLSIRWGRQWNEKFYSSLRLSGSNFFRTYRFEFSYKLDSVNFSNTGNFPFLQENEVEDSNLAIDNEWLISKKITLEFGFSGMEYNIRYKTQFLDTSNEEISKGNLGSLYCTGKFNLTEKLNASFGVRWNHHQINDEWFNEPRLSLTYKVSSKFTLKTAIGRYYQFVNQVQYDDPYNGIQNFWAFAKKDGVPVVQSNHYIIGGTYNAGSFLFDIEGYYKDLEGVVEFNPVPYLVKDGNLDFGLFLLGRGRMRGIDFLIQKETGIHKAWLSYSLSRSLHAFPSIENATFFPSLQDQPHEIKLVNMLKVGKWHLSSTWVFGSGRPFPEFDILYFTDNNGNVEDLAVMKDRTNFNRLPDYHRLDLAAAYNFTIGKFTGQTGLSIFNVYGRRNVKTRRLSLPALLQTIGKPSQPLPPYRDLVLIDFTPSVFVNVGF